MALRLLLVPVLLAFPALASDDWGKVKDLPSGSDLKIFERGSAQPKLAKYADLTDSSLIIVVKNEQIAIPKEGIDRIDARPPAKKGGKKMVSETHVDDPAKPSTDAGPHGPTAGPERNSPGSPNYSSTTSFSSGGGEFSTVYRRASGAPAQKPPVNTEPRQSPDRAGKPN
jgi:hypothetical protein